MSRTLDTTKLIKSVRQRSMTSEDTATFTDDNIIEILNEEIDSGLLTVILTLNEEHLVYSEEVSLNSDKRFPIPYRAIGNKLRDVCIVASDGVYELSRVSLERLSDYTNQSNYNGGLFYIEGNEVVLVEESANFGEKLRFYYYLRPNSLVKEKYTGTISNIDTTTGIITLQTFPADFSSLPQMDFISNRSPNKIYKFDVQPSSSNQNTRTVTFDPSDLPKDLKVGDYLCKREETPVPNIPTELHPILAQRAAIHILEAQGDTEGLTNARLKLLQMEQSVSSLIDNRVEGAPQKISPRHSTLEQTLGGLNRRRRRF